PDDDRHYQQCKQKQANAEILTTIVHDADHPRCNEWNRGIQKRRVVVWIGEKSNDSILGGIEPERAVLTTHYLKHANHHAGKNDKKKNDDEKAGRTSVK